MGKNTDTGTLDDFTRALAELDIDGAVEVERAHGRGRRKDGGKAAAPGSGAQAAEGSRGDGEGAAPVAAQASAKADKDRTALTALSLIRKLAKRPDRFKALEEALWENIDVLVPAVMSMTDITKALQALRESNMSAERASGSTSEDPLREIRKFLAGAEKEKVQ